MSHRWDFSHSDYRSLAALRIWWQHLTLGTTVPDVTAWYGTCNVVIHYRNSGGEDDVAANHSYKQKRTVKHLATH